MVNEFKLTVVHFARSLTSVPLCSERSRVLAGMRRDKAPLEWPRSEGGNPTDGWMLGWLLWKPTPKRGPLHESHWPKPVEKGKGKAGRQRTRRKGRWERLNKQLARSKLQMAHISGVSGAQRQILVGERVYARLRLRLRFHTLTSVNQDRHQNPMQICACT